MKTSIYKSRAVVLATAILISACNTPTEQKSNLNTGSDAAVKKMEQRLAETVKVRDLVKSIERALRPVDGALSDVMRLLGDEKNRLKSELPSFAVSELRYALRSLTKNMAIEQEDGSWVVEKQVEWPFERVSSTESSCSATQVGISARNMSADGKSIEAELYIRDCTFEGKKTVAIIERTSDGKVNMDFDSSSLEAMEKATIKMDSRCSLQIEPGNRHYGLVCMPFDTRVANVTLRFKDAATGHGIWYVNSPEGEAFRLNIGAFKSDGSNFADLLIEQKLGDKPQVVLTRKAAL